LDPVKVRLDSIRLADSTRMALAAIDTLPVDHRVIIAVYPDLSSADKYVNRLKNKGVATAEVYVKDTANYLVLMGVNCRNRDTMNVFDSLKKVYNYQDLKSFK